jgi:hypothetical protein
MHPKLPGHGLAKLGLSIINSSDYKEHTIYNEALHVDGVDCSLHASLPNLKTVFIDGDKNFMYYNLHKFMNCESMYVRAPFPLYNHELYGVLLDALRCKKTLPYIFISEFGYTPKGMPNLMQNLLSRSNASRNDLAQLVYRVYPVKAGVFENTLKLYREVPLDLKRDVQ